MAMAQRRGPGDSDISVPTSIPKISFSFGNGEMNLLPCSNVA